MPTPPDFTYPQYHVQRWRVLQGVPVAQQLLLAVELPYAARVALGPWRWFALAPFPHEWARAAVARARDPYEDTRRDEPLEGQSERIAYFDPVRRVTGAMLGAGEHTFELCRVRVPGHAIAVLERIATWLRVKAVSTGHATETLELWDNDNTSPWPFPLQHPDGGTLTVEWVIIRARIADTGREPALGGPVPADTCLVGPWADGRFWWGNTYSSGMKWVTGSRSNLRFFVTVRIAGLGAWDVEAAGRLSGFTQSAGTLGAHIRTVVSR